METRMHLKVSYLAAIRMTAPTFRKKKNNNKVASFSTSFLMSIFRWISEKELKQEIANQGDEFCCKKKHENVIVQGWVLSLL